jgi:hypothetical protein
MNIKNALLEFGINTGSVENPLLVGRAYSRAVRWPCASTVPESWTAALLCRFDHSSALPFRTPRSGRLQKPFRTCYAQNHGSFGNFSVLFHYSTTPALQYSTPQNFGQNCSELFFHSLTAPLSKIVRNCSELGSETFHAFQPPVALRKQFRGFMRYFTPISRETFHRPSPPRHATRNTSAMRRVSVSAIRHSTLHTPHLDFPPPFWAIE